MNRWLQSVTLTIRPGNVGVLSLCHLLGCLLLSCQSRELPESSVTVLDDLDRSVALQGDARRIVSLSPAITELLVAIGGADRLVGRTQWDVTPDEVLAVTNVGVGMPPNVEAVASVHPDLVVLYASEINRRPIEQLAMLGIPSLAVKIDLLESLPRVMTLLGAATGLEEQASREADGFRMAVDSARSHVVRDEDPVRVVILTWDNPPIVIGAGSFLNEMIILAGAENAFANLPEPSAPVSIEAIADRDPDVFLVTTDGDIPAYASRPEWRTLRAIAERRFALVSGTEFQWPSMRSLQAIPRLRSAIVAAARRDATGTETP